jgi:hypothetical protein
MRLPALLIAFSLAMLLLPASASAVDSPYLVPQSATPSSPDVVPPRYRVSPRQAAATAERLPQVRAARAKHPTLFRETVAPLYTSAPRWEVGYAERGGDRRLLDVEVNGATGKVVRVWKYPQTDWVLSRGIHPSVGGDLINHWYVWIPLCLVFFVPFFDPRRPFRLLHLDLLVLLLFGVSLHFFNKGNLDVSVPSVYPLLLYLLGRLAFAGFRPRERRGPVVPLLPMKVLAVGLVLLVAFRVAINLDEGRVIDVGLASTVGAARVIHKEQLYTDNDVHGDTYGPINYIAYIPFELALPYNDTQMNPPSAQAAAITFDLLTIIALVLLGARLRPGREGRRLGLALAFAWAAFPFSTYVLQEATNDSLVALLIVCAMLAMNSAPARGALLGLSAAAKFAPLGLAPLLAAGTGDRRPITIARFTGALVLVVAGAIFIYLPDGGLREFWNATLGYQLSRSSPFSVWGLYGGLDGLKTVVTLLAAVFAVSLYFFPKRRDARQVVALAGAVTIALQLTVEHWFYFYIVWFLPLALVAMFGAYRQSEEPQEPAPERQAELATA